MATIEQIISIDNKLQCCGLLSIDDCEIQQLDFLGLDLNTTEGQWQASYEVAFKRVNQAGCISDSTLSCLVYNAKLKDNYIIVEKKLDDIPTNLTIGGCIDWGDYD